MIKFIKNFYKLIFLLRKTIFYGLIGINGVYRPNYKTQFLFFIISPINFLKDNNKNLGKSIRSFVTDSGPIFIKFAQMMSTRPDLIGDSIAKELSLLQDKMEFFDYKETKETFIKDFGSDPESIFTLIDTNPIAAASVGQVYKWKNSKNIDVAVKLLRPKIREQYKKDIEFLYFLSFLGKKLAFFKNLNPIKLVGIFENMMKKELNMKIEASSADELRENARNDDIIIPKIYWEYVSENILVMEWIDAFPVNNIQKLIDLGLDLNLISTKIATMFFNQAFRDGFFHADLHPGNILITKSGKICIIDFGIVSRISDKDRFAVAEILFCFFKRDYKRITQIHIDNNIIPDYVDLDLFTSQCRIIGESIIGVPLNKVSLAKLLADLLTIINEFEVTTQPQLFFLQKTMLTVEGIGQSLNNETNMWKLIEPLIKKWAVTNITPEAVIYRYFKKLIKETLKT